MEKSFRTELGRARGLGSAHGGTGHFWLERLLSFCNVPFFIFFVILILSIIGEDYHVVRTRFAHPIIVVFMGLMAFSSFFYMKLGMQVVIEDYISRKNVRILFLALNVVYCFVLGSIAIFSILKVALGG